MSTTKPNSAPATPLEEVIIDDSEGKDSVNSDLATYAQHVKKTYPADTNDPQRPFIQGALIGVGNADLGINDEVVEQYNDSVLVIVPPYKGMKAGELVVVFWNDVIVSLKLIDKNDVGHYLTLRVDGADIPKGSRTLSYHVQDGGKIRLTSPSSKTLFRIGQPGVDGAKGVDEELSAPTVTLPASKVIGAADAKAKIKVTVAPYLSMNVSDVITLYWGDETIDHVVTAAEVGKPVVIMVDEAVIKKAGDSKQLPVYYFVTDVVGNESEWSKDAFVHVQLQSAPLTAPVVVGADGKVNTTGKIDLTTLGSDHVLIRITGQFKAKDLITLNWNGTSGTGQVIPVTYGPEELTKDSTQLEFKAPFEALAALSGGSTRLTYTLKRNGTETTSEAAFIDIEGEAVGLPPPVLNKDKNEDYWIGADHTVLHVRIPVEAGLKEEDEVTVRWIGVTSDNKPLVLSSKMIRVSKSRVGKVLSVQLRGSVFLKPLDGGWVDVFYQIKRGEKIIESDSARYDIGYLSETLPAPFTEQALPSNVLDPELPEYEYDLEIFIPKTATQPTPCTVTLYWETSEGGYFEDEQRLQAGDEVSPFQVPAEYLNVKGDVPVKVTVYYIVSWENDDKPDQASQDFVFNMATQAMLQKLSGPLTVPAFPNGSIDLSKITRTGLVIEVPHYHNMAVGDVISIKFGNTILKSQQVTKLGKQSITLTLADVAKLNTQEVVLSYHVERHPSGDTFTSQPSSFTMKGSLILSAHYENFNYYSSQFSFRRNAPVNYYLCTVELLSGSASQPFNWNPSWFPTTGALVYAHRHSQVLFRLKVRARSIAFDIADASRVPSRVEFFDHNGRLIGSITTPAFTNYPSAGYTIYSTRVSYITPGELISSFKFIDGGGDTFIDNLVLNYV
ncbi:hypothetical protein ACK2SD_04320 [Pseudomonas sp. SC11]|uniref:hypothetical protein n=1 Tax=Pseudomonas sp. SC11 TaxID=326927 RepID=UPI00399A5C13